MRWFLLDSWDLAIREDAPNGYSLARTVGEYEYQHLQRCPICGRRIWPMVLARADSVEFTGKRVGDITYEFTPTLIVSERFRSVWAGGALGGLTFSDHTLSCRFKKSAVIVPPSKNFYFAYPDPRLTTFAPQAEAAYSAVPRCRICGSAHVRSLKSLAFEADRLEETDCCIPSCLPGWTLISDRAVKAISSAGLRNFQFVESFYRDQNNELVRIGCWVQNEDGSYTRHDSWRCC
jgi:hypothetical protein